GRSARPAAFIGGMFAVLGDAFGAGRSAIPPLLFGGIRSSRSSAAAVCLLAALGAGSSASSSANGDFGAGLLCSTPASGLPRLGAGRSARSSGLLAGGTGGLGGFAPVGIAGTFGTAAAAGRLGSATRDLQLVQVTNFAPIGTSASEMRFGVPHAAHVASIIQR